MVEDCRWIECIWIVVADVIDDVIDNNICIRKIAMMMMMVVVVVEDIILMLFMLFGIHLIEVDLDSSLWK